MLQHFYSFDKNQQNCFICNEQQQQKKNLKLNLIDSQSFNILTNNNIALKYKKNIVWRCIHAGRGGQKTASTAKKFESMQIVLLMFIFQLQLMFLQ